MGKGPLVLCPERSTRRFKKLAQEGSQSDFRGWFTTRLPFPFRVEPRGGTWLGSRNLGMYANRSASAEAPDGSTCIPEGDVRPGCLPTASRRSFSLRIDTLLAEARV